MPEHRRPRVVVVLEPDEFQHLADQGERDTRSPDQQAVHIIRRYLQRTAHRSPVGASIVGEPADARG